MNYGMTIIQIMVIAVVVLVGNGCSIDIDRSETANAEDSNKQSEDLMPKQENRQPDKDYVDETSLELSIVEDEELGKEAGAYDGYKVQVRLHDIRCLQKTPGYKYRTSGWSPDNDNCLVFARSVFQGDDDFLKFNAAPYGVYFLSLKIYDAENNLIAQGSDNVVIVRDALNESQIAVIPGPENEKKPPSKDSGND
jgi:hypothetical protein